MSKRNIRSFADLVDVLLADFERQHADLKLSDAIVERLHYIAEARDRGFGGQVVERPFERYRDQDTAGAGHSEKPVDPSAPGDLPGS
jgi:hypothetical protein